MHTNPVLAACPQLLASGSCVDGSICGAGKPASTCRSGTTLQRRITPDEAIQISMFSSVHMVFPPGSHTVLIRQNSYMGCGTGSYAADCYSSAPVAFKVQTGELEIQLVAAALGACFEACPWCMPPGQQPLHLLLRVSLWDPCCCSVLPAPWRLCVATLSPRRARGAAGAWAGCVWLHLAQT